MTDPFSICCRRIAAITALPVLVMGLLMGQPAQSQPTQTRPADLQKYQPPRVGTVFEYQDLAIKNDRSRQIIDRVERVQQDILLVRQYIQGVERVGHRRSLRNLITIDSGYQSQRSGRAKIVLPGIDTTAVRALWPFRVGAKLRLESPIRFARAVTTRRLGDKMKTVGRVVSDISIIRAEKITVPAGTFDCFLIHRTDRMYSPGRTMSGMPTTRHYRIWFAPRRGIPVKVEFAMDRPDNLLSRRTLKAIRNDRD